MPLSMERVLNRIHDIPSLPIVVEKLLDVISDPTSDARSLGREIAVDQGLSMKILKLVNSAFYGFSKQISSIQHAVALLGFNTVRQVALGASILDLFGTWGEEEGFSLEKFWVHSFACACCAKKISEMVRIPKGDDIFIVGLLHDIGKLIEYQHLTEEFREIIRIADKNDSKSFLEAEEEVLGTTHVWIGEKICEKWSFPPVFSECIKYHHEIDFNIKNENPNFKKIMIINLSNFLTQNFSLDEEYDCEMIILDDDTTNIVKRLGIHPEFLKDILIDSHERVKENMSKFI